MDRYYIEVTRNRELTPGMQVTNWAMYHDGGPNWDDRVYLSSDEAGADMGEGDITIQAEAVALCMAKLLGQYQMQRSFTLYLGAGRIY